MFVVNWKGVSRGVSLIGSFRVSFESGKSRNSCFIAFEDFASEFRRKSWKEIMRGKLAGVELERCVTW